MRIITSLFAAALAAAFLSGCNTAEGFGEDVEATGRTLQDWAGDEPASEQPPANESDRSEEDL